jgi:hypothetical protein
MLAKSLANTTLPSAASVSLDRIPSPLRRLTLRLEPGGIEQQRVQFFALARLGKMTRKTAIDIPASPLIRILARALEGCGQRVVQGDEPVLSGLVAQEMPHGVVQSKETLT